MNQLRLENTHLNQAKVFSARGTLLIDRVHDVVARAFKDERVYNLLDLRAMVCMACELSQPEQLNDLIIQDKLYQVMETIIAKLQSLAEIHDSNSESSGFAQFIESCISVCTTISRDLSNQQQNLAEFM